MKSAVDRMYALLRLKHTDPAASERQIAFGARYVTQWDEPSETASNRLARYRLSAGDDARL